MSFLETREGRRAEMRTAPEARHFMRDNPDGWRVVGPRHGSYGDRCGLVAHRGVLHPDEHVNEMRVLIECERLLGFTSADLWEVYAQGRKSAAQRELRARVDQRLLEIADAGGNLELLARVFEVDRKTIGRALARARQVRKEASRANTRERRCTAASETDSTVTRSCA
jgi:hypothetical protein